MKIRAFNIDWDTDGEVVEGLPKEVIIDDLDVRRFLFG